MHFFTPLRTILLLILASLGVALALRAFHADKETPDAEPSPLSTGTTADQAATTPEQATAKPEELATATNKAVTVQIVGTPGNWTLLRNGEPFYIKGACASTDFEGLVKAGANTIRTYSPRNTDRLQGAREAGLAIVFGMWLGHERHGFSYTDKEALELQRERVLDAVRANKDDPQILMWAIGNEMEGKEGNPLIWQEVNYLAQRIKEIDSRPVLTVIAGAAPVKLKAIAEHCPDLDLVGINAYGGLPGVQGRMLEYLPNLPYMITEYGTRGPWESPKAPWGTEYEPTSSEKAALILDGYENHIVANAGRCLGSFAFLWGWKQEATHTWFGMYLKDGSPTEITDALQRAWSGQWPQMRAPSIKPLHAPALEVPLSPGQTVTVSASAQSPYGSALFWQWELYDESRDRKSGGDAEQTPRKLEAHISPPDKPQIELTAPEPGKYRLFLTVKDDRGHAVTANLPVFVR